MRCLVDANVFYNNIDEQHVLLEYFDVTNVTGNVYLKVSSCVLMNAAMHI